MTDVTVPTVISENIYFVSILKVTKERAGFGAGSGTDPRIQIRIKMPWIQSAAYKAVL
jgi:hypothetical protein